jgi:pimeloyl-ACP methyl ester carboxylesterase
MPEMVKKDGGVIFYDVHGPADGPSIVLIEGLSAHLLGWREGFWQSFVDEGFRVIRFDNRDVGLSQHYPDQAYGLGELADDAHELIQHLDIVPTHVVGQSMGGMVAQLLAVRHPTDVESLALLYTATSAQHFAGSGRGVETLENLPRASTRDEAIEIHIQQERPCASIRYSFDDAWKRELGGLMWDRCYDPDGVVRQSRAVFNVSIDLAALAEVSVPTLLVHGTSDQLIRHTGSLELHHAIMDSDLWLIEGMGHDLPVELWPDITSRILGNIDRAHGSRIWSA